MAKARISPNISYNEGVVSATAVRLGIPNIPNKDTLARMKITALNVFEPVRAKFGPIQIISFFRCPELNDAVGGSDTSQHMKGEAIDMVAMGNVTNAALFRYIKENLIFDQLIWEFGTSFNPAWIHVSYSALKRNNKMEVLRAVKKRGRTVYYHFSISA